MVAMQAKVVRNGKTTSAKVTAEAQAKAKEGNVSEKVSTPKAAPAKAAPAKAATKQATPQAKAKTAPAKAKAAPAKAEPQATPYWQYSREALENIYAILSELDPETLEAIEAARDAVGTKTAMALVIAAANGDEPNYDRLMKGRE